MSENSKESQKKIKQFAINLRRNILDMALSAGANSSHFGGALSIADILATLFATQIKFNKQNPLWEDRDRFILSKGHACLAYYSALSLIGFIKKEQLQTFEENNTDLLGHPVINKNLGIEFSTGSLGMGLSLGIGLALAAKKRKKDFKVFVVLGDGECNEGSIWEAAMAAPNLKLDNLNVIIDRNNFQQTGSNKDIMDLGDLKAKWSSFNWSTAEVNGHNISELFNYFQNTKSTDKPKLLVANTIKGKGFSFSENNNTWHHNVLSKTMHAKGVEELKNQNDN